VRGAAAGLSILLTITSAGVASAGKRKPVPVSELIHTAERKLADGTLVPETDLAPLLAALDATKDDSDAHSLVTAIGGMGRSDGRSPAAVKAYLRQEGAAALVRVVGGTLGTSPRESALMALRNLAAEEAVAREAIRLARLDPSAENKMVRFSAQLLEDSLQRSSFQPQRVETLQPKDPEAERRALAVLRAERSSISSDSLRQAAADGRPDLIAALLDAGVPLDRSAGDMSPLGMAVVGCAHAEEDQRADRLGTLAALVGAGASLADAPDNFVLVRATQMCPLPVVRKLVELGANPAPRAKGQGVTPLSMALISGRWDVAGYLVDRGARLSAQEVDALFIELPTEPEVRALIKRAQAPRSAK
jgi:hypothetical protein